MVYAVEEIYDEGARAVRFAEIAAEVPIAVPVSA